MTKEYADREKNRLFDFCRYHDRVYLYGAGAYGKMYYDILQKEGIIVAGFITTGEEVREYCGLPVYNVENVNELITEWDGVIPAYKDSIPEDIGKKFHHIKPDILSFDHQVILWMDQDNHFLPIIQELKKEFPVIQSIEALEWKNILVIRLDVIGDIVCTTAFIRELKKNYPKGNVTVIIRKQMEGLLKNCPYIDQLILYEEDAVDPGFIGECERYINIKKNISEFSKAYFKNTKFDAVFLPGEVLCGRNRIDELLMVAYSKADCRIGRLVGIDNYRSWAYHVLKDFFSVLYYQTEARHEALYSLDMLKNCGLRVEDESVELWLDEGSRRNAKAVLDENGIKEGDILIAVGLVGSTPAKSWKAENYKELINEFHKRYGTSYKFLLFGGKDATEAAGQLTEDTEIIVDLTGKLELDITVACMEHCELYVGADTGLLHIATAVGKPSVTLYKTLLDVTDQRGAGPWRWGARREDSIALLPPPGLDGCHGVCKKNYSHCINQIIPSQVERAIEKILVNVKDKKQK